MDVLEDRQNGAHGHFPDLIPKGESMVPAGAVFYYHPKYELRKVKKYYPVNGGYHPKFFEWVMEEVLVNG